MCGVDCSRTLLSCCWQVGWRHEASSDFGDWRRLCGKTTSPIHASWRFGRAFAHDSTQAALAGREEDSSDDEEDLMTHPWSRRRGPGNQGR